MKLFDLMMGHQHPQGTFMGRKYASESEESGTPHILMRRPRSTCRKNVRGSTAYPMGDVRHEQVRDRPFGRK